MIGIVGIKGNMGYRYRIGLEFLKEECCGWDYEADEEKIISVQRIADKYIIATPTETHIDILKDLMPYGKPILCEKPIVKTREDFEELKLLMEKFDTPLFMVNQYNYIRELGLGAGTYYNYYNTGKDGVFWDCIQLIHLARGDLIIKTNSPVWKCKINGVRLSKDDIDGLYLKMLSDFQTDMVSLWGKKDILEAHEKVFAYESANRNSS